MNASTLHNFSIAEKNLSLITCLGFLGKALAFLWFTSFLYFDTPWFSNIAQYEGTLSIVVPRIIFIACVALTYLVCSIVFYFTHVENAHAVASWLALVALACTIVGFAVPNSFLRGICFGVSATLMSLCWDCFIISQSHHVRFSGGSCVFTGLALVALTIMGTDAARIFLVPVPLASFVLFFLVTHSTAYSEKKDASCNLRVSQRVHQIPNPITTGYFLGVSAGVYVGFLAAHAADPQLTLFCSYCIYLTFICAGLLLFFDDLRTRFYKSSTLLRLGMIGLLPALLVLPYAPPFLTPFCIAIIFFVQIRHATFDLAETTESAGDESGRRQSRYFGVSIMKCIHFLGYLIGFALLSLAFSEAQTTQLQLVSCGISIYLMALLVVRSGSIEQQLLPRTNSQGGCGGAGKGSQEAIGAATAGDYRQRAMQVGIDAGLTSRQMEVMLLLLKGRTARFIEQELFISRSTAKSHIAAIYGKFDVHSQQELMDFIDEKVSQSKGTD